MLGNPGKAGDSKREHAAFNSAKGLPVNANQFRQTFLSQPGLQPRPLNVFAYTPENLTIVHQVVGNTFQNLLTPHILSVNI